MDGFKKPGTNILPLFSLQCDKIQCQSGTTMTAALYCRWVDWPHISVEILPSLVFNECSHVFLQGNKIIRTFQSVNVDPLHVSSQETHAILTFTCQFFFRILYERRPELECNWMKKKLEVFFSVPIGNDFQRRAALPSSEATTSGVAGWNNGAVGEYEEIIDSLMRQIAEQPHKVYSHTWYLSFFLHWQNFWKIKFTLKNANFLR